MGEGDVDDNTSTDGVDNDWTSGSSNLGFFVHISFDISVFELVRFNVSTLDDSTSETAVLLSISIARDFSSSSLLTHLTKLLFAHSVRHSLNKFPSFLFINFVSWSSIYFKIEAWIR